MIDRDQVLADCRARTQAAQQSLIATISKSHAEIVCESIAATLRTIELARMDAQIVNKYCQHLPPITNDDLADLLRLRLQMLEAYEFWSGLI